MTRRAHQPKPPPPPDPLPVKRYRVLSARCVWGKQGDFILKALEPLNERALIQGGVLEEAPAEPWPLSSADTEWEGMSGNG